MKKIFLIMLMILSVFGMFEVGGYPSLKLKDLGDYKAKPQSNEYLKFNGSNWISDSITEGTDSVGFACRSYFRRESNFSLEASFSSSF